MNKELQKFACLEDAISKLHFLTQRSWGAMPGLPGKAFNSVAAPNLKMARFDYAPVASLRRQIDKGIPFTAGQHVMAHTLVTKYKKQWKKNDFDIGNLTMETPLKMGLRRTDPECRLDVDVPKKVITLKFPYMQKLIAQLYNYKEAGSAGLVGYDKHAGDHGEWRMTITPENIDYISLFALRNGFDISDSFKELEAEFADSIDYNDIKFDIMDGEFVLHNGPESMREWIDRYVGDINLDNFLPLVAKADALAINLSAPVINKIFNEFEDAASIVACRESWVDPASMELSRLIEILHSMGLKDVVVFTLRDDPAQKKILEQSSPAIEVVSKIPPIVPDAIISTTGFMLGPNRKEWFRTAYKTIYYCNDIDPKIKKIIKKNESNLRNKR